MDLIVYGIGGILIITFMFGMTGTLTRRESDYPGSFIGLIVVGFILIAYSRNLFGDKFKAGDCIQMQTNLEKWEKPSRTTEKILEVGKYKYRTVIAMGAVETSNAYMLIQSSRYINLTDDIFDKVECSAILKEYK